MSLLDKLKNWLASDEALIKESQIVPNTPDAQSSESIHSASVDGSSEQICPFEVPDEITQQTVLEALMRYGLASGYVDPDRRLQVSNEALLASVRNQTVKMHEEILGYYQKRNLTPDEKLLNRLTVENMFFLAMGTAILAKVKKTNLIAQGFFAKMLKKSGPEFFYREVMAMAGHKYGSESEEALHKHVQRATYLLLSHIDTLPSRRQLTVECGKAMYMYGLGVTIK